METILRSIYDLLGPNSCIHPPFTDETIEQHSASIFEVNFLVALFNILLYSIFLFYH